MTVKILTPFFIGEPEPGLNAITDRDWILNAPPLPAGATPQQRMTTLYRALAAQVENAVRAGEMPVSVCGDCLSSIGVLAGLQRAGVQPTLLWFDAHGDFHTWETTTSRFLGGMPLAMLVGRGEQTIVTGTDLSPIPENRVILTDGRDLDPGEREAVAASGITHFPQPETLLEMPLPSGALYVHFDVDVINPADAPAMRYPAPGGATAETLHRIFRRLHNSGQIAAISVSAWDTTQNDGGKSQSTALALLQTLIAG